MRKRAPKKSVKSRKAIKIQKNGTFICKCHFFYVILQRKMNRALVAKKKSCPCGYESFAVFSSRRGDMSFGAGVNTGHIDKRRLTRFVLANSNLVNSQIPKHCDTRCP